LVQRQDIVVVVHRIVSIDIASGRISGKVGGGHRVGVHLSNAKQARRW